MRSPDSYRYLGGNAYQLTHAHATELGGRPVTHRACNIAELEAALAARPLSLVIGFWEGPVDSLVDTLVTHRPPLRHLFLGDVIQREAEISWIKQSNMGRIFEALPDLETLRIRGSDGLALGSVAHVRLKTLIIESGGLPMRIAGELAGCTLPALEHLELWLGRSEYGASISVEDLEPLLVSDRLPRLDHLGLRNSQIADEVAPAVLQSSIAQNLRGLDLSLGIIGDRVAKALLGISSARAIHEIDVGHHHIAPALIDRLRALGNVVGLDHRSDDGEDERYTAIGE